MEFQLQNGYSTQNMIHAINICKFSKEYTPRLRVMALRYIFMYIKDCKIPRILPSLETLLKIATDMYEDFTKSREREYISEIADIINTYGPDKYKNIFLNKIRNYDEKQINTQSIKPKPPPIKKTVYADSQNVHNSKINESVNKVVSTLYNMFKDQINLKDTTPKENETFKNVCMDNIGEILIESYPNKKDLIIKSMEYIKSSIAVFGTDSNINLKDIFIAVWLWINEHKDSKDLITRLLEELKEMNGMCTTGHVSRLVNVIQGFTDDENLCIRISNSEQFNAVVRNYLTLELSKCTDEKVLEEMIDGGESYIRFIRRKIADRLLPWQKEYGQDILEHVVTITNDFSKTTIFVN